MKKNNLDKVKDMAVNFLYIKPEPSYPERFGNLFVSHPYLNTEATILPSTGEMFSIFSQPNIFQKWQQEMTEFIRSRQDLNSILLLILAPYKLTFFKYICDDLSKEDFAKVLVDCYTDTEFPSNDVNVPKATLLRWFKKADKKFLMDDKESKALVSFPEIITVYRGVCAKQYREGLSWTLDKDKAEWFAKRFSYDNAVVVVYECQVPKSAVLAFFDGREKEIILDYNCLKNCVVKEYEIFVDNKNESC